MLRGAMESVQIALKRSFQTLRKASFVGIARHAGPHLSQATMQPRSDFTVARTHPAAQLPVAMAG